MTMMARFRWLWRGLTRPRSLSSTAHNRPERKGIAILVVISSLLIITVLITELVYTARVRYMVALHERDRVQAYWLARSGVNMHQLILLANKEISNNPQVQQGLEMLGMGGTFEFWNFPFVQSMNTGLLRMLLSGGGDIDSVDDDVVEVDAPTEDVPPVLDADSSDVPPSRGAPQRRGSSRRPVHSYYGDLHRARGAEEEY